MRSKTYNKPKKKLNLIPASPVLAILMLVTIFAEAIFMIFLEGLDVLPGKFAVIVLILLIGVLVLIIKLLNCRKKVTKQRKIGVIVAALLIVILGVGSFYLYSTYSMFHKISGKDQQTEDFYVVALKHGSYDKIKDVKGKTVHITKNETDTYKQAKDKLEKKAKVTYKEEEHYLSLGHVLIDKDGETHDEVIFLSDVNYQMLEEGIDDFEKKTKIIYTISIPVDSKDVAKRIDVTKDSFNVYISGIDTFGGINKVARSDVNMIMTVNPKEKKILLTSIPRDMYVKLHSYGQLDKLTHSGIYGVDETVTTVEDWLGIDINYYVRVNFTTLVDVVNVIDGVDVESDRAFKSSVSKYRYTKGTNHLDGEAALYFARERKSFKDGDNQRIKNQQKVLKGIIEKVTGSTVILRKYTKLLDAVGSEMQTNLKDSDISKLVKMQLNDLGGWTIESISIKGKGTKAETYSMGSQKLYVAIPDDDSVAAAQEAIQQVMAGSSASTKSDSKETKSTKAE